MKVRTEIGKEFEDVKHGVGWCGFVGMGFLRCGFLWYESSGHGFPMYFGFFRYGFLRYRFL